MPAQEAGDPRPQPGPDRVLVADVVAEVLHQVELERGARLVGGGLQATRLLDLHEWIGVAVDRVERRASPIEVA